jgi:hypothetical protein
MRIGDKEKAVQDSGTPERVLDLTLSSPYLMVASIADKNRTQ